MPSCGWARPIGRRLRFRFWNSATKRLIADPDAELARLCGFLGIAPNPSMTDFAQRANRRAIASPQSAGLAGGVSAASRGQWRRYAQHLAPVLPVVAPWVRRFGYGD